MKPYCFRALQPWVENNGSNLFVSSSLLTFGIYWNSVIFYQHSIYLLYPHCNVYRGMTEDDQLVKKHKSIKTGLLSNKHFMLATPCQSVNKIFFILGQKTIHIFCHNKITKCIDNAGTYFLCYIYKETFLPY